MHKGLPSGLWCMRSVCSKHNEDALGPFRADSPDVCSAADDCQSLGIMRPGIRRLWRGIGGICGRMLAGLCCLSRACTPTAPEDDSLRRRGGGRRAEEAVCVKERKEKHPRATAKHSALKRARFPHVACCYQRDRKQNRGMSVSQTVSGMRWSASRWDELTLPNILYRVRITEETERFVSWFSAVLLFLKVHTT